MSLLIKMRGQTSSYDEWFTRYKNQPRLSRFGNKLAIFGYKATDISSLLMEFKISALKMSHAVGLSNYLKCWHLHLMANGLKTNSVIKLNINYIYNVAKLPKNQKYLGSLGWNILYMICRLTSVQIILFWKLAGKKCLTSPLK